LSAIRYVQAEPGPATFLPANLSIAHARLPASYETAKAALANCASIDECVDWADKSEALAAYARQADDDALEQYARRIRARAIRRAGELLKQIEPGQGARDGKRVDGADSPSTRTEMARQAGMSERQQVTAIRVANVPASDFERQVEGAAPPTVTKLAGQGIAKRGNNGSKPSPLIARARPDGFAAATNLIGTVEDFAEFCRSENPEIIAAAVMPHEVNDVREQVGIIDAWLDRFVVNMKG
jgi:hypothetical protein